jgi:ketosteroid isomerase-like protein
MVQMDEVKQLVDRFYDRWNAHDLDGWLACCNEDITFTGPGGLTGQGFETGRMFYSLWQDAFPNTRCTITAAAVEGNDAIQEALFRGTHTQMLRAPTGDIQPTGKTVAIPYMLALRHREGKWSSFHIIFDQVELMTQLGLVPTPTSASG